jgi:hypothetical protein
MRLVDGPAAFDELDANADFLVLFPVEPLSPRRGERANKSRSFFCKKSGKRRGGDLADLGVLELG